MFSRLLRRGPNSGHLTLELQNRSVFPRLAQEIFRDHLLDSGAVNSRIELGDIVWPAISQPPSRSSGLALLLSSAIHMKTLQRWSGLALALGLSTFGGAQQLSTLFAMDTGGLPGGAIYFDITVATEIEISGFQSNFDDATGIPVGLDFYLTPGTYAGNELNGSAWKLMGSGSGNAAGLDMMSTITLAAPALVRPGSWGVCLVENTGNDGHVYSIATGPASAGGNEGPYADSILSIGGFGTAQNTLFAGFTFSPRVWNGCIDYVPVTDISASLCASTKTVLNGGTVTFTDDSFSVNGGITASWDLDGDSIFESTGSSVSFTYPTCGTTTVTLMITDSLGLTDTTTCDIQAIGPDMLIPRVSNSGAGCGSGGGMVLNLAGQAVDGSDFGFEFGNVPATGSIGVVHLGMPLPAPIDLRIIGARGCTFDVNPFLVASAMVAPPSGSTARFPLAECTSVALNGTMLSAQGIVVAPGENPLNVVTSDTLSFSLGNIRAGEVTGDFLSGMDGLIVTFEGSNTFTSPSADPFFNVFNNSTTGEAIYSVTIDFDAGGIVQMFDVDQTGINSGAGQFDMGDSSTFDPTCPNNSYVGTDKATGLIYAGSEQARCATAPTANTGWISRSPVGREPQVMTFNFNRSTTTTMNRFTPGTAFQFNADTDNGLTSAENHAPAIITIVTDQRTVSGSLTVITRDLAFARF